MKLDITRLPVGELLIGFVLAMTIVAFVGAFIAVGGDGEEEGELVLGSPTPEAASPTPEESPAGENVFEIAMVPLISFDATELVVPANSEVTVRADNQDTGILHNWAAYTDDSATELIAGTELCTAPCVDEVTFTPPPPGEYFFRCDVHPIQMVGTLIVE